MSTPADATYKNQQRHWRTRAMTGTAFKNEEDKGKIQKFRDGTYYQVLQTGAVKKLTEEEVQFLLKETPKEKTDEPKDSNPAAGNSEPDPVNSDSTH